MLVLAFVASAGVAQARPLDVPHAPESDRADPAGDGAPAITAPARPRRISLGLSAVWLLMPMLRATAEYRLTRHLGLAVILGVGRATSVNNGGVHDAFVEGGSVRYYPTRFDHGLQLGADLVKQAVPANSLKVEEPYPQGIALAPFVGFKHIYKVGFSFEAQLGVTYLVSQKDVFPKAGDGEADTRLGVLLNLNAGWSF